MKDVKHSLKIAGYSAVAAMMLAACGGRGNKENASDKVEPAPSAKVAQIKRSIDSLETLHSGVKDERDSVLECVNARKDEIDTFALRNGILYVSALRDYLKHVNAEYPMKKALSEDDAEYFSKLAKKILARESSDKWFALSASVDIDLLSPCVYDDVRMKGLGLIPSDSTAKRIESMVLPRMFVDYYELEKDIGEIYDNWGTAFFVMRENNPIEAVRRVADGTGSVLDIEIMVRATRFGQMGMTPKKIKELENYVSLDWPNCVRRDTPAGRTVARCIAKMNEASVAGLVKNGCDRIWQEPNPYELDSLSDQISVLEARITSNSFRNPAERKEAIEKWDELGYRYKEIQKIEERNKKQAALSAEETDDLARRVREVDPYGLGVNFSIPEMQGIEEKFKHNAVMILALQSRMASDKANLDSLNRVLTKYRDEIQDLNKAINNLQEKQK